LTGALLFYTDGVTIWDKNHVVIDTGLSGGSGSTTSALIVPKPANSGHFYVLTVGGSGNPLKYTLVDASNPSSISIVTGQRDINLASSCNDKIAVTRGANCDEYWIVTKKWRSNSFNRIKLSSTGFSSINIASPGGARPDRNGGQLKFSPDGTKLVYANRYLGWIQLFDFIPLTGAISSKRAEIKFNNCYGIEFSPDSKMLYFAVANTGVNADIYQADAVNPLSPRIIGNLSNPSGGYSSGAFQLGPDKSIYIARDNENSVAAITSPDTNGVACNLVPNAITLSAGTNGRLGLPSHYYSTNCPDGGFPDPSSQPEDPCRCNGCNQDAEQQNKELLNRAGSKFFTVPSTNNNSSCSINPLPINGNCTNLAIQNSTKLKPCFYFHWGDGNNDQIEEHDTEVFYLTVCNNYNDITFKGLRITKITLIPTVILDKIHIVPDRFVSLDCLEPCSCQTREFAMITRANDTAGNYTLEVEYCYEEIVIVSSANNGIAEFPITITED